MDSSSQEKLRITAEEHNKQMQRELEEHNADKRKSKTKLFVFLGIIVVAIIIGTIVNASTPGPWDGFAKCLTEKGVIVYGAIEWCSFTKEQAGMFGKSFKYINYEDYKEIDNIKKTPTWLINGERYEGVQSFQHLSELTGCKY